MWGLCIAQERGGWGGQGGSRPATWTRGGRSRGYAWRSAAHGCQCAHCRRGRTARKRPPPAPPAPRPPPPRTAAPPPRACVGQAGAGPRLCIMPAESRRWPAVRAGAMSLSGAFGEWTWESKIACCFPMLSSQFSSTCTRTPVRVSPELLSNRMKNIVGTDLNHRAGSCGRT